MLYTKGTEEHFHHLVVNECDKKIETYLKENSYPTPGDCYGDLWLPLRQLCGRISLVWAVGGSSVIFLKIII